MENKKISSRTMWWMYLIVAAKAAFGANASDWRLAYALTIHSSQGPTISDPQNVWIIDDYLTWSNLVYLVVSHVEYLHQLQRVELPLKTPELQTLNLTAQYAPVRATIQRKLVGYN